MVHLFTKGEWAIPSNGSQGRLTAWLVLPASLEDGRLVESLDTFEEIDEG